MNLLDHHHFKRIVIIRLSFLILFFCIYQLIVFSSFEFYITIFHLMLLKLLPIQYRQDFLSRLLLLIWKSSDCN